jgi:hypothetical protein
LETSPYRGMTPQNYNESQAYWFRTRGWNLPAI